MGKLYTKSLIILVLAASFTSAKAALPAYFDEPAASFSYLDPFTFKVYPNPATGGTVQISYDFSSSDYRNVSFSISNVIGQNLFTYTLKDDDFKNGKFTIDLEELKLEKGVYLIKMTSGDHSRIQKLVVR